MSDQSNEYAGDLINIIMKVPQGTSYLSATAKLFDKKGEPVSYVMEMDAEMLAEARQDFLDNVEDGDEYDVRYVISDYGRATLEQAQKSALQEGKTIYD